MKEISELLKKNDIRASSYRKNGNVIISDTNKGKIVIKKNNYKDYIYNYLDTRNFNYYPDIIENDKYVISRYIEDVEIPSEQKIIDLVDLVSLLHSKTTHYREISEDEYKKIYEDLSNNYEYLYEYYLDIISLIAAPVLAVITPILVGYLGISFLWASSNKSSLANLFFNFSKRK